MIDYIQSHMAEFWFIVGFVILAVEVLIFGFTTGILLFSGLGCLVTGGLMMAGMIPATWIAGLASVGISSGIVASVLWKPLKNLQGTRVSGKDNSSDFVGLEFVLEQDITPLSPGKRRYSGINWRVEIDTSSGLQEIRAGTPVKVCSVDVGVFRVTTREKYSSS